MLKKFAENLKSHREKKKISLIQIANETRIHITNFEKIENGDFTFMPQPYIRAFLKQYIKALGLDEKEILYNFDLAKSGKFQPIAEDIPEESEIEEPVTQKIEEETEIKPEIISPPVKEKNENVPETMETLFEEKIPAKEPEKIVKQKPEKIVKPPLQRIERERPSTFVEPVEQIKVTSKPSFSFSPSFFKSLGIIAVIGLLGYGIYLIVITVFLPATNKSKFDIVRQNFDTVVKENEKKILGKRSKEEIEDSLMKAQNIQDSIKKAQNDSLTLEIKGIKKGFLSVITDSIANKNMDKENFDKGYQGIWKAKKYFYITSNNTSTFEIFLNGKKIKIEDEKVKYLKISREGIIKK